VRPGGAEVLSDTWGGRGVSAFAVGARNGTLHILPFAAFRISTPPKHSSAMGCPLYSARFPRGTIPAKWMQILSLPANCTSNKQKASTGEASWFTYARAAVAASGVKR
jgi:hypothetical protein